MRGRRRASGSACDGAAASSARRKDGGRWRSGASIGGGTRLAFLSWSKPLPPWVGEAMVEVRLLPRASGLLRSIGQHSVCHGQSSGAAVGHRVPVVRERHHCDRQRPGTAALPGDVVNAQGGP